MGQHSVGLWPLDRAVRDRCNETSSDAMRRLAWCNVLKKLQLPWKAWESQ